MTIQDIIDLTKAGYTKDDIAKLTQAEAPAPATPAPATPAPAQDPKPASVDPALSAIQNQIETLKQMMQLDNIKLVNQEPAKQRTIDDIFAEIINPPMPDNKDK